MFGRRRPPTLEAAAVTPADTASSRSSSPPPAPGESVQVFAEPTRDEAMQLPAVVRARNILCGVIGALPLRCWRTMAGLWDEVPGPTWLEQPDPNYTRIWVLAQTVDDLLFTGRAYWRVRSRFATGYPAAFEYLMLQRVSYVRRAGMTTERYFVPSEAGGGWEFHVDGRPVDPRDIVRFDGIAGEGVLRWGAREIRTGLALADAARRFAAVDLPAGILRDLGAGLPDDAAIDDLLNQWESARRSHTTAYLSPHFQFDAQTNLNPQSLQLIEARQMAALEISRLFGIPATYEAANVGTAGHVTYSNLEAQRRDLLDMACGPWITSIEQRLSLGDVTPAGTIVRFDPEGFTRQTSLERWQSYEIAVGIGAMTTAEVRNRETETPPGVFAVDPDDAVPDSPAALAPPPATPAVVPPAAPTSSPAREPVGG